MTIAAGTRLGPYEIVSALGAGGMGEVYQARDEKLDRDVAIKLLPAHLTDNPNARARFEREAKAVAALSPPNILTTHDFETHDGSRFDVSADGQRFSRDRSRSRRGRASPFRRRSLAGGDPATILT